LQGIIVDGVEGTEQCGGGGGWGWVVLAALAARTVLPLRRYPVWWINISQSELCKQASVLHIRHVSITAHFKFVPPELLLSA